MNMQSFMRYSVTLRVVIIAILALLLLIPVGMVRSVIDERENNRQVAISEISQKWGEEQTIAGPVLTVPYTKTIVNEKGVSENVTAYIHFLPEELTIEGKVDPEMRSRGIFEAVVYSSDITLSGSFAALDVSELGIRESSITWDEAFLALGIPDMRGIEENIILTWNGEPYDLQSGILTDDVIRSGIIPRTDYDRYKYEPYYEPVTTETSGNDSSGVSVRVPALSANSSLAGHTFELNLKLNGSQALQFVPLGRTTHVSLSSDWPAPKFDGSFLPDEREVTDAGFSATWEILDLNRNYPQTWVGSSHNIYASAFGLQLLVPVDTYQKSTRAAKYSLLIIALTYLVFFFVEIFNKKRIHPIQYVLVGLALVLFYSLLIAFSEIVGFEWAYLIASIATIGLIVLYSKHILGSTKMTQIQGFILAFLYMFVYTILQLEDYAFLAGSVGLFIILSAIMYLSRKIDWYAISHDTDSV